MIKLICKALISMLTMYLVIVTNSILLSEGKTNTDYSVTKDVDYEVVYSTSSKKILSDDIQILTKDEEINSEVSTEIEVTEDEHISVEIIIDADDTYISEEYIDYIIEICDQYNICPELVMAMIESESGGNPNAKSGAQCIGLMQVSPKWNRDRMERLGVTDLYDPYSNILVGVDFLAELFDKYGEVYVVLMCYNEGEYGTAIERASNYNYSNYAIKIVNRSEELERLHGK